MKLLQVAIAALLLVAVSASEPEKTFPDWEEPSFVETDEQFLPDAANLGYVASSVPFDNPGTLTDLTPTIPSTPDCTVRPQTIVEIKRMRRMAARVAQMIQTEVAIMEKRKTYVEQMTSYLNDRIRELNKVKSELQQENRWIEVSNQRIAELAQKEKLIKMQDVLSCLNNDQQRLQGAKNSQTRSIMELRRQTTSLTTNIDNIRKTIKALNAGVNPPQPLPVPAVVAAGAAGVAGLAGVAGAVPGAPVAAPAA